MLLNREKFKIWKKLFEDLNGEINSDKSINMQNIKNATQFYIANKSKLLNILNRDSKIWEEEANKIINGNKYLSIEWKLIKTQKQVKELQEKLNKEIDLDLKKEIQKELIETNKKLNDLKSEVNKKMKEDLESIK